MSNDQLQSIMALIQQHADSMHDRRFSVFEARKRMMREIESAIRAIAAPGVAQGWQVMHVESKSWGEFIAVMDDAERKRQLSEELEQAWLQFDYCDPAAPSPTAEQPTPPASSPEEAARSLAKWLNERPNSPINLEDVAMLVHHVQSPPAIDKAELKRLVSLVFGDDFQIVRMTGDRPKNSQDWKGMDGACAFHLIERHADGWGDVALMMGEWLAANAAPPTEHEVKP